LKCKVGECPNPPNGKKSVLQVLQKRNVFCDEDILPPKGSGYWK